MCRLLRLGVSRWCCATGFFRQGERCGGLTELLLSLLELVALELLCPLGVAGLQIEQTEKYGEWHSAMSNRVQGQWEHVW